MKFDMTSPCPKCPFRTDVPPYLRQDRAQEIADDLTRHQQTFACHQTITFDGEGEYVPRNGEQHCAGALIVLEKMNRPNQMMRWMERLGGYDRRKLKMDAPVFDTMRRFVSAQRRQKVAGR